MSVSSELRLDGHVDFDVLFEMVKLLFDKGAKKNFKVDNLGPIAELDDVKEVYGESKDYEVKMIEVMENVELSITSHQKYKQFLFLCNAEAPLV